MAADNKRRYTIAQVAALTGYTKAQARVKLEELVSQGLARKKKETVEINDGKSAYYIFRPTTKFHIVYTLSDEAVLPNKPTQK